MQTKNKYYIQKKLFWIPIITTLLLFGVIFMTQGLSAFTKSAMVDCPIYHQEPYCNVTLGQDTYNIPRGTETTLNQQNTPLVNFTNYFIWIQILTILTYNHLKYNLKKT